MCERKGEERGREGVRKTEEGKSLKGKRSVERRKSGGRRGREKKATHLTRQAHDNS